VIRVLLVDDERPARDGLRVRLERAAGFEVVGEAASGREAIEATVRLRPDLMFLDIRMPDLNGFEVLRGIPRTRRPRVIFVTAYDRHALEAIEVHALDYLLKPVVSSRFAHALERARTDHVQRVATMTLARLGAKLDDAPQPPPAAQPGRLVVREGSRLHMVPFGKIQWVAACGNYVTIHAGGRPMLHRMTLGRLAEELPRDAFARIHRGTIVNLAEVVDVQLSPHGDGEVRLRSGEVLRLSRRYRAALGGNG